MALQILFCNSIPNFSFLNQNHRPKCSTTPKNKTHFSISLLNPSLTAQYNHKDTINPSLCLPKRELNLSVLLLLSSGFSPILSTTTLARELELERYSNFKEGFTLLRPSSWLKIDKAGASVLFEEAGKGSVIMLELW